MQVTCRCSHVYLSTPAPCPDAKPGDRTRCLVAHYDGNSFICPKCGYNSFPDVTAAIREGRVKEKIGAGYYNPAALKKLMLS